MPITCLSFDYDLGKQIWTDNSKLAAYYIVEDVTFETKANPSTGIVKYGIQLYKYVWLSKTCSKCSVEYWI